MVNRKCPLLAYAHTHRHIHRQTEKHSNLLSLDYMSLKGQAKIHSEEPQKLTCMVLKCVSLSVTKPIAGMKSTLCFFPMGDVKRLRRNYKDGMFYRRLSVKSIGIDSRTSMEDCARPGTDVPLLQMFKLGK